MIDRMFRHIKSINTKLLHPKSIKMKFLLPASLAIVFLSITGTVFALSSAQDEKKETYSNSYIPVVEHAISYTEYTNQYSLIPSGEEGIVIRGADYMDTVGMEDVHVDGDSVFSNSSGKMTWTVNVKKEGMYQMQVEYYPMNEGGSTIERILYINDEMPFDEASPILFYRTYINENDDYKVKEGNQAFPSQIEYKTWKTVDVKDSEGYFDEPLKFYFKEGKNTITFESTKDAMLIKKISLHPLQSLMNYAEYVADYQSKGYEIIDNNFVKVQGEDAIAKSSPSFYPLNDRTSPLSEPYDPTYIVLNTIGGEAWDTAGDFITWNVKVPKSGLYQVVIRYKQNQARGIFVNRTIKINDKVPFQEAKDLRFHYSSKFQITPLKSSAGDSLYFYFEEGMNTITLENTLGAYGNIIYEVQNSAALLNDIYQDIVVITGTSPDIYQDYQLTKRLPDMLPTLEELANHLKNINNDLIKITGGKNDRTSVIDRIVFQLEKLIKDPEKIPKNITGLRDNITALGQWILNISGQPLTIDYIVVSGSENMLPKAEGNLFQMFTHEIKAFIGSFTNDYNSYSVDEGTDTDKKGIEVWVTTGRDQMDVIRQLINESFVSTKGIPVTLKLVNSGVLLTATSVGRGPDAVVQVSSTVPVDFAIRDAAYDLSKFSDFKKIAEDFHPSTLNCFEFDDKYYGLPDQMSFPVLFYRKDILNKHKIPIPETWEDVISIIPFLQANNMEFYLDRDSLLTLGSGVGVGANKAINTVYLSMLYQNGGELYNEDGSKSLIDSKASVKSFTTWNEFYTKHGFSITMDFVTRFRLGEVPLAIMDFTNYNRLSVSAPEIKGDWSIAMIPGTKKDDGTIRRDLPVTTSASVMIKNSVEKHDTVNETWEFLKWWTSEEVQSTYAREMEAILGSSGRYPVANLKSFEKVAWQSDILKVLSESLTWLREVRQVPGSYLTGRYLENALYEMINNKAANEVDVLYEYNTLITDELHNKRTEFGLER